VLLFHAHWPWPPTVFVRFSESEQVKWEEMTLESLVLWNLLAVSQANVVKVIVLLTKCARFPSTVLHLQRLTDGDQTYERALAMWEKKVHLLLS